ncbi:MAG: hypothetical protein R2748_19155 [Bryobacterales bacterium]
MAKTAMLFGVLLILLGLVGWVGSGMESPTALIPAVFGLLLLIAGAVALNESRRKHAMHAAAMVGLLGFGPASGLLQLPALLGGAEVARPAAVASKSAMAVLSAIFVALCVRSFIAARRARTAG